MKTLKIKPSHESQGDFVVINEEDFNPEVHELLESRDSAELAALKTEATALGVGYASNVTAKELADKIAAFKAMKKPSDGLTVAEIKEALAAKNVTIPDEVTLKADLAALLDSQPA